MTLPMASVVLADPPSLDAQANAYAREAKQAIGRLTILASEALTVADALAIHAELMLVYVTVIGGLGVALDKADRV